MNCTENRMKAFILSRYLCLFAYCHGTFYFMMSILDDESDPGNRCWHHQTIPFMPSDNFPLHIHSIDIIPEVVLIILCRRTLSLSMSESWDIHDMERPAEDPQNSPRSYPWISCQFGRYANLILSLPTTAPKHNDDLDQPMTSICPSLTALTRLS